MKLIKELNETEILIEEKDNSKNFFIISEYGVQIDKKNKNGRIYPKEIAEKEINRYKNEKMILGQAWGELGHPDNVQINETRISHRYVEVHKNGGYYYLTKAKILNTPNGKIVKALIEDKEGRLGTSTRALGSLKEDKNGNKIVQSDFHLVTLGDIVVDPSAQKAFISGVLEGKEYEFIDGMLVERVVKNIKDNWKNTMSVEEKQEMLIKSFQEILEFEKYK